MMYVLSVNLSSTKQWKYHSIIFVVSITLEIPLELKKQQKKTTSLPVVAWEISFNGISKAGLLSTSKDIIVPMKKLEKEIHN